MDKSTFIARAPGRVSVMGAAVDYNGGPVTAIAVPLYIDLHVEPTAGNRVEIYAENLEETAEFSLDNLGKQNSWIDYVQGVASELSKLEIPLHGFRGVIKSTLPMASGLSSSAALEVAAASAFLHLANEELPQQELALLCQRAENNFVGVPCGILDQTAIVTSRENQAMLLYCNTMQLELVPFVLGEHALIVTDSGVSRELGASEYGKRRESCHIALRELQKHTPNIKQLCDLTPADLPLAKKVLLPEIYKRAHHVITEIDRTKQSVEAMRENDWARLGELLNQTHESLRHDYETSSKYLDWLVDWTRLQKGVLGSRLTGAGFGGCTITLIEREHADEFMRELIPAYREFCGIEAKSWSVKAVNGAHIVENL